MKLLPFLLWALTLPLPEQKTHDCKSNRVLFLKLQYFSYSKSGAKLMFSRSSHSGEFGNVASDLVKFLLCRGMSRTWCRMWNLESRRVQWFCMTIERVVLLVVKVAFWWDDYCRLTGFSSVGQKPIKDWGKACWSLDLAREDTARF